jgi:hypothetical protein
LDLESAAAIASYDEDAAYDQQLVRQMLCAYIGVLLLTVGLLLTVWRWEMVVGFAGFGVVLLVWGWTIVAMCMR